MSNLSDLIGILRTAGYSKEQAAGIAGNAAVESNLDPTALNPAEGAIGLFQWEGGRRAALQSFAASRGTSETDLRTQELFAVGELRGPESAADAAVRAAKTPGDAAAAFDQLFERSDGSARQQRMARADQINTAEGAGTLDDVLSNPLGALGSAASGAANAVLGDWTTKVWNVGLPILAVAAAAGLFIVGARHALTD